MITTEAKISILSGDNNKLSISGYSGDSNYLVGNNISGDSSVVLGKKGVYYDNPFILGVSPLGLGDKLSKPKYIYKNVTLSAKEYSLVGGYYLFGTSYAVSGNFLRVSIRKKTAVGVPNEHIVEGSFSVTYGAGAIRAGIGIKAEYAHNYIKNGILFEVGYMEIYEGTPYFISNQPSQDDGVFEYEYTLIIKNGSSPLKSLTIAFDTVNNRHPRKINIDGVWHIVDDAIFTVVGLDESRDAHNVYIYDWNTPFYPLVITGIYTGVSVDINKRNLISYNVSLTDRSDLKLPSFGIISNTGDIEFKDTDGEVEYYAKQGLLSEGLKCNIKLKNTLSNTSTTIAILETDEWNYDSINRVARVSLKDDLEEWQDISIPAIEYNPMQPEERPLSWFYQKLWGITTKNNHYKMNSLKQLDSETQKILDTTMVRYPLLYASSLWAGWQKLCEVGLLHIYKENDVVKCRYNGGN